VTAIARLQSVRYLVLATLTVAAYAIELAVVHHWGARIPARTLGAAVTFDLAVVVPFAWWLFALRGGPRAGRRLLPVVVASLAGAALVAPSEGRALLVLLRAALVPLELFALVVTVRAIVGAVRLARTGADVAERLEHALTNALGDHAVARLLAAEGSAVFFALLGGRPAAGRLAGVDFTLREARAPAFTWGLVLAVVVESGVVHAVLGAAHPAAAWAMTGLGAYAVLWLVGQDRALSARTITVEEDRLVLRVGLRLTAHVPWPLVSGVSAVAWSTAPVRGGAHADVARPAEANLLVRFREPIVVTHAFGLRRRVSSVGIRVDDPEGLRSAIQLAAGLAPQGPASAARGSNVSGTVTSMQPPTGAG
jgi:hypothetical protein